MHTFYKENLLLEKLKIEKEDSVISIKSPTAPLKNIRQFYTDLKGMNTKNNSSVVSNSRQSEFLKQ